MYKKIYVCNDVHVVPGREGGGREGEKDIQDFGDTNSVCGVYSNAPVNAGILPKKAQAQQLQSGFSILLLLACRYP